MGFIFCLMGKSSSGKDTVYQRLLAEKVDTISTYVVNATKGSQTEIKTALWALSTIIFVLVVLMTIAANRLPKEEEEL